MRAARRLAGAAALRPRPVRPQEAPRDHGIGGTGMMRTDEPRDGSLGEGDRGIGGTGVIGTIRRFGSIIVNDLRITYPQDVPVRIDGRPAALSDLRIGHVVRVVALETGGILGLGDSPSRAPWSVVSLLAPGPTLSRENALVAHDGLETARLDAGAEHTEGPSTGG